MPEKSKIFQTVGWSSDRDFLKAFSQRSSNYLDGLSFFNSALTRATLKVALSLKKISFGNWKKENTISAS